MHLFVHCWSSLSTCGLREFSEKTKDKQKRRRLISERNTCFPFGLILVATWLKFQPVVGRRRVDSDICTCVRVDCERSVVDFTKCVFFFLPFQLTSLRPLRAGLIFKDCCFIWLFPTFWLEYSTFSPADCRAFSKFMVSYVTTLI